jgi:two-component system, NtrC family, response regulator AlgB
MNEEERQVHVRISKETYMKLKVRCAYQEISIQDYIVNLIEASLGQHRDDKISVLLVEDEAILRDSLKDSLKDTHNVAAVGSAEEALELLKQLDFDVVVTDVRLPGKDGLQLVKEIRETKPYIKPVIITAYPSVELAVGAMKQGAVDYLVKPVTADDLEKIFSELSGKASNNKRNASSVT